VRIPSPLHPPNAGAGIQPSPAREAYGLPLKDVKDIAKNMLEIVE